MLISILSFVGWLVRRDKRWSPQTIGFMAFLVLMVVGIPMAANNYWAFWTTYGMAVVLLSMCVPLPSVVTSIRRVKLLIYAFVAVAVYVGVHAILHEGFGPSGSAGAQDENYVAAMMGMAIPFAYFSIFIETRRIGKLLLGLSILVFCGAIVVGFSRGGFVGFCAVVLYCMARSPKKLLGFGVVTVIVLAVLVFASPAYWQEMATISDLEVGTADERLELWKIGLRMFIAHPVFGVGAGSYRWTVGEFQSPEQHAKFGRNLGGSKFAHSLFVELLAELGLTGAVVLAALLWRTWMDLRQVRRGRTDRRSTLTADGELFRVGRYADAVTGSILACLVNGVFLSLLYFSYLWLLIALATAITQVFRAQVAAQRPV
jgi:O-antigen ligase